MIAVLIITVVLVLRTPADPATGWCADLPDSSDGPSAQRPELRSRGPPGASVRLARPTVEASVLSARSAVPRSAAVPNDMPSARPHPTDP